MPDFCGPWVLWHKDEIVPITDSSFRVICSAIILQKALGLRPKHDLL